MAAHAIFPETPLRSGMYESFYLRAVSPREPVGVWIRQTVHVKRGSNVTFVNNGMAAPHTVTFGVEQPNVFVPYGDPTHFAGQPLNSGILPPGGSFTVTFTKKGVYHYICALHDYLHMVGTVVVD